MSDLEERIVPFVELASNSEHCSKELNSDSRVAVYLFIFSKNEGMLMHVVWVMIPQSAVEDN
jgi:hypothetical protein